MKGKKRHHSAAFKAQVALEAIREIKTQAEITSHYEVHTTQVRRWKSEALAAIEAAFSQRQERHAREVDELNASLYEQIGKLQMELQFLKKNLDLSLAAKRSAIERENPHINVARQCELLGLSRSSYYYETMPAEDKQVILNLIDEHYCLHPAEGARKVSLMLKSRGYCVGRYATQRLMQEMGIEPIYPKPNTSVPNKAHAVYPYLLRDMEINTPNHVWAADITYCRLKQGFAYLIAIIDWYSRYVIEWELSSTLDAEFCVAALKRALTKGRCDIFNTDQGSQFTSSLWINELKKHHIDISMDGKGRYLDNIFVERLWRSVKCECIYLHDFQSMKHMREGLTNYFEYYNFKRPHQGLDYLTPAEVYFNSSTTQG